LLDNPRRIAFDGCMTNTPDLNLDEKLIASQEFQKTQLASKLNWLRAGVLGANDGIMSTSGILMGVAGATTDSATILLTGVAAVVAGSISMAGGEYTSVSAQRDSELAALEVERAELAAQPELELRELTWFYEEKGLSYGTAKMVAEELTAKDALKAHAEAELGIEIGNHASPMAAAVSSFVAFSAGGILPLVAVTGPWVAQRIPVTVIAVVVALIITGYVGSKIGGAKPLRPILRNVIISLGSMAITYGIGVLVGHPMA
jgi:VIT1/CCC1 family predicted Fe2+/Mn2+ transporter